MRLRAKTGWYGVRRGQAPGVYSTWEECVRQVKGFSGAEFRKFATLEEAEAYCESAGPPAPPARARHREVPPVEPPRQRSQEEILAELCPEQAEVAKAVLSGGSVFFTGEPGSGKSFLMERLVELLRQKGGRRDDRSVAVCASTGAAAVHVGGSTLHSLMGWGPDGAPIGRRGALTEARALLLDEVSMIPADLVDRASRQLSGVRSDPRPFGGLQVVMSGDFLQLPPVGRESDGVRWAFEAEEWRRLGPRTFRLQQNHRQAGEAAFQELLREVRVGRLPEALRSECVGRTWRGGTRLVCTNREADSENHRRLEHLPGEARDFQAVDASDGPDGLLHSGIRAALSQLTVPETLSLKVGARVMLLKNLRLPSECEMLPTGKRETPLVNGSTGEVVEMDEDGTVTVQFCGYRRAIRPEAFTGERPGVGNYSRVQLPLRLAWALTVHKCQGMTLHSGSVDLSRMFEPAQMYVALSRFRSLSELRLDALPSASQLDNLVRRTAGDMRERAVRFHESLG